jgi:hypothetical protein
MFAANANRAKEPVIGRKSVAGNEIRKQREVSQPATEFRGFTR